MIYQALDTFDNQFGLTQAGPSLYNQYGPASTFLTILNQNGQPSPLPGTDPTGRWESEAALDVEWVHGIAPGAQIIVVESNSEQLADLMAGASTAASQPGVSVVSMSWGLPEGQAVFQQDEAWYDADLHHSRRPLARDFRGQHRRLWHCRPGVSRVFTKRSGRGGHQSHCQWR